ncbi:hypothetical protein BDV93DRAFT_564583 [Ceratobasidium sp. AG-I]|nr:hypothetical protein BDV93DRAFT_564583 [Ceratobasidium sp. AG-I]
MSGSSSSVVILTSFLALFDCPRAKTHAQLSNRLRSLHPGCPIQQSRLFPLLLPPLIALSKQQSSSLSLKPLRPMASPSEDLSGSLDD